MGGLILGATLTSLGTRFFQSGNPNEETRHGSSTDVGRPARDTAITRASLERIELALSEAALARKQLGERLEELEARVDDLRHVVEPGVREQEDAPESNGLATAEGTGVDEASEIETKGFDEGALLSQGLAPSEVARLREIWERHELERESITNRAIQEGWFFTEKHRKELGLLEKALREELPDDDFDRYLYALGQPNRLVAARVLSGSSASEAGLRRGDMILRYGDVRVFKPGELLMAAAHAEPGTSIPLEILRDGRRRTLYVDPGPLGVIIDPTRGEPIDR